MVVYDFYFNNIVIKILSQYEITSENKAPVKTNSHNNQDLQKISIYYIKAKKVRTILSWSLTSSKFWKGSISLKILW